MGIKQNEIVDNAAKEATLDENIRITMNKIPHSDMKEPIRNYILDKWQKRWMSSHLENNEKYRKIRSSVTRWFSASQRNRRNERVLTRLRICHSRVTHSFLFEGNSPPECDQCHVQLTIEHILVDCIKFHAERLVNNIGGKCIKSILAEDCNVENIMNFLKDTEFYYKI